MEPLARSARRKAGIPVQTYAEHVDNVIARAKANAAAVAMFWHGDAARLVDAVRSAAEFHDLGKLDTANQEVLASGGETDPLPLPHWDAGAAHLKKDDCFAAALVGSHHKGLPDFPDEMVNHDLFLRDREREYEGKPARKWVDDHLDGYLRAHQQVIQAEPERGEVTPVGSDAMLFRMALSCLVDSDHYDAARHGHEATPYQGPSLRPADRLALLDAHIDFLGKAEADERSEMRRNVYDTCRNANTGPAIYACDSPVGTGKTTAVMAHLLQAASDKDLRRVIVVLPFTNIIDQSVDVYRRTLVGLNERAEDVVAAHHHRAEFDDLATRQFSFLWHAPVVVTTAVQFFETLAGSMPAALRKLHQVPGSAIFIDEAHAALPAHLWPQAWSWLRELESKWGCHIVLGSGSLNRFWELEEFAPQPCHVPELSAPEVRTTALVQEKGRVTYQRVPEPLAIDELLVWLRSSKLPGPRLLILNTVQSAAVIANALAATVGRAAVEHLSTALCPRDRKRTLDRVKARLRPDENGEWTLVATSCVEAGVDLSFRSGIRESSSLNSILQVAGRVNRHGKYETAVVWDLRMKSDPLLATHKAFEQSSSILEQMFGKHEVGPEFCTEAMRREVRITGLRSADEEIRRAERNLKFPTVTKEFIVIDSNTVTAIVDGELCERLEHHGKPQTPEIQNLSVQIWDYKKVEYGLEPVVGFPHLFKWNLLYDDFLGYMAGVLPVLKHQLGGSIV